jgi:large subunit ribosomal protein L15
VNVSWLQRLVEEGRIDPDAPVTPEVLVDAGASRKSDLVKILGDGEISTALDVHAHAFSASAQKKIEAAGGSATTL